MELVVISRVRFIMPAVLAGLASGAYGSFSVTNAVGGGPYSGQADANIDFSNFDVKIKGSSAAGFSIGSGALFAMQSGTKGGANAVTLGIATSDFLMNGNTSWTVSIPDGVSMFSFSNAAFTSNYVPRGVGALGKEDLGFMGLTILQNQVGASTWSYLQSLSSVNGNLATASATAGLVIHNYGYGESGEYLTAAGEVLTTNDPSTVQGFRYLNTFPPADQPGVGRVTNQTSLGIQQVNAAVLGYNAAVYGYNYNGLTWTLPAKNPANLGQITNADDGGAIVSFTGAIVGINAVQNSTAITNVAGQTIGADYVYGSNFAASNFAGAGVAFDQGDLNFLNNQFALVAAPEPASIIGLGALAIAVVGRRRRS
ncbi:MAG: PEP-CTERM sorting domain-containing protein [Fimbriimonadaceae bacterium]